MFKDPIRRLGTAMAAVSIALGLGFSGTAEAGDPQVCGYVRYGEAPTSTVPSIPYCEVPCDGIGPHVPPGDVNGVHYEALVCVWGL